VANALTVRKGNGESCNCKLTSVADTDNHIVLVDRVLKKKPNEAAKDTLSRLRPLHFPQFARLTLMTCAP